VKAYLQILANVAVRTGDKREEAVFAEGGSCRETWVAEAPNLSFVRASSYLNYMLECTSHLFIVLGQFPQS